MKPGSIHRLEALGLIVGPITALFFFALEPGASLIEPASVTDPAGRIAALANNSGLAHLVALLVPLGLLILLYGMAGVRRSVRDDESATAAWIRFGILSLTVGGVGWILADGVNHMVAEIDIGSQQAMAEAIPMYQTAQGITLISGLAVALGLLVFSLAISTREPSGFPRVLAWIVALASVVAMVALMIGQTAPSDAAITVARACYVPWAVWSVSLGWRSLKPAPI